MKYIISLVALLALASCTTTPAEKTTNTGTTTTNSELNQAIDSMSGSTNTDVKVVKLDAPYENPQAKVDMTITYELDSEGKITKMDINATTFDISAFENYAEKEAIGKTVAEASKIFVSGGSLTSEAFQKALKSQL